MLNSAQRHDDQSRPTHDAIEAIIHHATSSRPDQRPLRDTRTQLFVGNLPYRVRWQDLKDLFRKAGSVLRADVSLAPDNRSRGHGTVVLATAEDAGRAVDMFNGFTWQTRVLEVRLDRFVPDSEDVASGAGMVPSTNAGGGGAAILTTTGATGSAQYNPHMTMPTTSTYVAMSSRAGASTNLPLTSIPNPSGSATSSLATSFASPWPSQDHPLDFLHSSGSTTNVLNFQIPDPNANRTLFVGNLPFHIQWQDLKDLFRKAGTILRADVALGPDNRSRGFGTVVFGTDLDAERAIKLFNGYEQNGRILKVHYDRFSPVQQSASSTFPLFPTHALTASSLGQHPASASVSLHSSAASSVAHSAASSPRPGQASEHLQLSSSLPSHLHTSLHALTRSGNLPSLSALHRRPSQIQLQTHGHNPQIQHQPQQNIGGVIRPSGFLYDYGASSRPSTPLKVMQVHQQQRGDQDDFEARYGEAQQQQQQKLGYEKQIQQHKLERLDAQLRERDAQWEIEGLQLHQQQLLQQREEEREWERHRVSRHPRRPHYEGPLAKPASASTPALDIESLTSSLASMRIPRSSASATGLSYGPTQRAGILSITPPSVSASNSVSVSASASVYAPSPTLSNPDSNARWTASSKPPSTSGRSSPICDRESEMARDTQDHEHQTASGSGASSQGGGQQQRQIPYHPGPISMPPPLTFHPMQIGMMPLTTMTPGHAPHTQMDTPHAMAMRGNPNMSPLYHPAHAVAYNPMAATAMHGGGSPSPFGMYPGPAGLAGAGMLPFTPRGLPTITPSMPAFTFLPQQYFPPFPGPVPGSARAEEGRINQEHHSRDEGDAVTLEGRRPCEGAAASGPGSQSSADRLHLNMAAAVPGGLSPSHTMSPGTFYGRPGEVPNPFINPAVGAPVHPIMPYPSAIPSPAVHTHHPAYDVGSSPYGGYFYGVSSSPMKGASSLPGMEPQGYFDPMYFPAGIGGDAGATATIGSVRRSEKENVEFSAAEEESPQEDTTADGDQVETAVVDEYGERVLVPSRTQSDGHDTRRSFATLRATRRRDAGEHFALQRSESEPAS